MNASFQVFQKKMTNPVLFRVFMLSRLPMGFISGLRIHELGEAGAAVSVRFKWLNQNPFKSIYFAVLSMAAELSTGILAFGQVYQRKPVVSMLVIKCSATFSKKATGKIIFRCHDGDAINAAVQHTIDTGEPVTIDCNAIGKNESGEEVAAFIFTWSFKAKQ